MCEQLIVPQPDEISDHHGRKDTGFGIFRCLWLSSKNFLAIAVAKYDYKAESEGELTIRKNEKLQIIDDSW